MTNDFRLSICICTRNRPIDLKKALISIRESSEKIHEVIVADDSTDQESKKVVEDFPEVRYIEGPRIGLGGNRNRALSLVTGTHVLFMDDDSTLGRDFVSIMVKHRNAVIKEMKIEDQKLISSGLEHRNGKSFVIPKDQGFLGFQDRPYRTGELLKTVVILSTIFPARLFQEVSFDARLIYGADEVDVTSQAYALGYHISLCKEAVNSHFPSEKNREYYAPNLAISRIYVTFKRYALTEKKLLKGLVYLPTALAHELAYRIKVDGLVGMVSWQKTFRRVLTFIIGELLQRVKK